MLHDPSYVRYFCFGSHGSGWGQLLWKIVPLISLLNNFSKSLPSLWFLKRVFCKSTKKLYYDTLWFEILGTNLVHKTFKNLPFFLASFIVSILINASLFIKSPSLSSFPLKKSAWAMEGSRCVCFTDGTNDSLKSHYNIYDFMRPYDEKAGQVWILPILLNLLLVLILPIKLLFLIKHYKKIFPLYFCEYFFLHL